MIESIEATSAGLAAGVDGVDVACGLGVGDAAGVACAVWASATLAAEQIVTSSKQNFPHILIRAPCLVIAKATIRTQSTSEKLWVSHACRQMLRSRKRAS